MTVLGSSDSFSLSFFFQEFQNVYQQFFPSGDPSKFADFVFNVFDSDHVSERLNVLCCNIRQVHKRMSYVKICGRNAME